MYNSHNSQIAHRLVDGFDIDQVWLRNHYITNQHKRVQKIGYEIKMAMPQLMFENNCPEDAGPFWPIKNIRSTTGAPTKFADGTTRRGIYVLPKKYIPTLKKVIKKIGW